MADDHAEGWNNRETWRVHLWLTNDEPNYRRAMQLAGMDTDDLALADILKEWIEGEAVEVLPGASLFSDLLMASPESGGLAGDRGGAARGLA